MHARTAPTTSLDTDLLDTEPRDAEPLGVEPPGPGPVARAVPERVAAANGVMLRTVLVAGCVAAVALAGWIGNTMAGPGSDPELALLLRGIGAIKGGLALIGAGLLLWRFGHPVSGRIAAVYLGSTWLAAAASMLVWQQAIVPAAAVLFHAGELTFLACAWFDRDGVVAATGRRRTHRIDPTA